MKSKLLHLSLIGLFTVGSANLAGAQIAYALANGGGTLVSFNLATPTILNTVGNISGSVTGLLGLDYRPADGQIYGYSNLNTIVTINPSTGVTTFVSNPSIFSGSTLLGLDFNPVADRLRIVNDIDQNLRANVATGAVLNDTALTYGGGTNPTITESAYTNVDNNVGTGTTIYYLDSALNQLATSAAPNTGPFTLVPGLGLGFDATADSGFDIYTNDGGVNFAYIVENTTVGGQGVTPTSLIHTIDLATGQSLGSATIGIAGVTASPLLGLTIIPEPSSLLLVGAGAAAFLGRRRRA